VNRSDTGPFAIIPVWVLDLPVSHLALRVYAVHADWADRQGMHHHGRKAIADRLGISVKAVDNAHHELVRHQALRIQHQRDAVGDLTTNRYLVCRVHPQGVAKQSSLPSEVQAATGGEAEFPQTRSKDLNKTPVVPTQTGDGKPPTPSASASLRAWVPEQHDTPTPEEKAALLEKIRSRKKPA
jgi:hypothetical protein